MAKPNASAPASDGKPGLKFKIEKRIVVPTMKVELNTAIFVRFEQPIEARKKMEEEKQPDGTMKAVEKTIEIARVTNLETGEICEIVAGTVLMSELAEAYEQGGYVGKSFRILKKDVAGKRYKAYELDEISVEA
jgi:hypothetical protein